MTDLDRVRSLIDDIADNVEIPNTGKRGRPAYGKYKSSADRFNAILTAAGIDYRIDQRRMRDVYNGSAGAALTGFVLLALDK